MVQINDNYRPSNVRASLPFQNGHVTSLIMFMTSNDNSEQVLWHLVAISDNYEQFKHQPRFHAEPYRAYFETTVAAAGASRKIADNIFCVPKGPLDTSR